MGLIGGCKVEGNLGDMFWRQRREEIDSRLWGKWWSDAAVGDLLWICDSMDDLTAYYNPPIHHPYYQPPPPPLPPGAAHQPPPTVVAQPLHHHQQYQPQFITYALPVYPQSSHDQLRTLFVAGHPEDVKPREIYNLFLDFPGYESSHLWPPTSSNNQKSFPIR